MSKKVKIILSVALGIFVLLAIFLPLTFFVFINNKLETPSTPSVVLTDTKIYVSVNKIEAAKNYIFEFTAPNSNKIEILSATSTLFIDLNENTYSGDFKYAGVYQVRCCVFGDKKGSQSNYSEIKFGKYVTLEKPSVNIFKSDDELMSSWTSIDNANLYKIYITSSAQDTKTYEYVPDFSSSNIETISLSDIMADLNLPVGEYQLIISAKNTSNLYYLKSLNSDPVTFTNE